MDYFDFYKSRVMGDCNSIKEQEIKDMKNEFEDYLDESLVTQECIYTKVDELPNLNMNDKELMAISDISKNDKNALDEKYLLVRDNCNIDVGCYVYWNNFWNLVIFEEQKTVDVCKKFVMRRCNVISRYKVDGVVYDIPLSISNLTMYSKGISDMKYVSEPDAKRNVFVGSNPITRTMDINTRVMLTSNTTFKITHVNDFEYTRRCDGKGGLLKWIVVATVNLTEDDLENNIPYNPNNDLNNFDENIINGKDSIYIGESLEYSINYNGNVLFMLDRGYLNTKIVNKEGNKCVVTQGVDFDEIGDSFNLIAKDVDIDKTIDIIKVTIRGV